MADHSGHYRNGFLITLAGADFELLQGGLQAVDLPTRFDLERVNKPVTHIYFPERGLASVVARSRRGHETEIGLVGREGWSGLTTGLGLSRAANHTFMQIAGAGHRIAVEAFETACEQSETLKTHALLFVHLFFVQISQTAVANAHAKLEERLARWLLMALDRSDDDDLPLTHDFLSHMLGVRRAGVSVALRALATKGLISGRRGEIRVEDREGLETFADGFYGVPEAEMRRLLVAPNVGPKAHAGHERC